VLLRVVEHVRTGDEHNTTDEIRFLSEAAPTRFQLVCTNPYASSFDVLLVVADHKGRRNASFASVNVAQTEQAVSVVKTVKPNKFIKLQKEAVKLTSNASEYKIGDVAKIRVVAPFAPCDGLATIRSNGIIRTISFKMEETVSEVEVPILEEYVPNIRIVKQ
jgi:hypothetical protein